VDATTRRALPYGEGSDSPDGASQTQALAEALDNVAFDDQGPIASRPDPGDPGGKAGDWYKGTDSGAVGRSDGVAWDEFVKEGDTRLSDDRTTPDASVTLAKLAPDVAPHLRKIGEVFMWWRPHSSEPLPDGCVPMAGQTLGPTEHGFASRAGFSITLDDMRDKFPMGANTSVTDRAAGSAADTAGSAPGIGGSGGSNSPRALAHDHGGSTGTAGSHDHGGASGGAGSHSHTINNHTHAIPNHTHNIDAETGNTGLESAFHTHALPVSKNAAFRIGDGTTVSGYILTATDSAIETGAHSHSLASHAHGGYTSGYDGSHLGTTPATSGNPSDRGTNDPGNHTHSIASQAAHAHSIASGLGNVDIRPQHVGLLFLIRVI
jgi:hypothetical protein